MVSKVEVRREPLEIPTYEPDAPDVNPMFLENRVYQGSSGKVYPLPCYNRISAVPTMRKWDSITLSNGLVEVLLLPEIGGRIHAIKDLSNGFDAIYRQSVIKPALVGLAGPWISGGIEFNWPQHHRPSTFMPQDVAIEHGDDGSITVWMGEHEPLDRTKGMHGVCLKPGSSLVEIKVRLYNRTQHVQTFLWWANIGIRVHEAYKSFFPPDASVIADHAKRAVAEYPLCQSRYYGVDYRQRGATGIPEEELPSCFLPAHSGGVGPMYAPNDLSWYANIPVPTSYMCLGTSREFFGGYDFFKEAGTIHVADLHSSPGKKQWTWGNHEFGYAWDRNLTNTDGPYIELMAGVFTDNQPDFSFIAPGETREFSQFLYPYQAIGPVQQATRDVAISTTDANVGIASTRPIHALVRLVSKSGFEKGLEVDVQPSSPVHLEFLGAETVEVWEDEVLLARLEPCGPAGAGQEPATEPPLPSEVASQDELYVIGLHLAQYRHATRSPADYWQEALRRDPGDMRCSSALGTWRLRRGEFEEAVCLFKTSIARATSRNPNPADGEPFYNLGVALRFLERDEEALTAFGKAAWNAAWQAPAWLAMAEIVSCQGETLEALELLEKSLRHSPLNSRARCLQATLQRKIGQEADVQDILVRDPLDPWARRLTDPKYAPDNQVRVDLALDHVRAGLLEEALEILEGADLTAGDGSVPMVWLHRAWILEKLGRDATEAWQAAEDADPSYCFPSRLEDIRVLEAAPKEHAHAAFFLGCLVYDRKRHQEAVRHWERAVARDPANAVAHRCLGIASFNLLGDAQRASDCYERAIDADPTDPRLVFERDQLWKKLGRSAEERLAALEPLQHLVAQRDDLSIEVCSLLLALGRAEDSAGILATRRFQPWEGGEGQALGVFTRTQIALARTRLEENDADGALDRLMAALNPPHNLGEARHLLANASDLWVALGDACQKRGDMEEAQKWWTRAADFRGDFQNMAVQSFSEMTFLQVAALRRLGRNKEANQVLEALTAYAEEQLHAEAKIDYFATSLPTLLLFNEDLKLKQDDRARVILAQAAALRGDRQAAESLLAEVLGRDPACVAALDLKAAMGSGS